MSANPAEPIRIVYFGTPAYAVPTLESLLTEPRVRVALVVTQPDRPAGRGRKLNSPPVKDAALASAIPIYQPESLRTAEDREPIVAASADLFVVAAFGKIFGPKLLALPRLGSVNLHASLLPHYRGASPISAAILDGRAETGVTLMQMDSGLDTGPILAHQTLPIDSGATTASLTPSLAKIGAQLLIDRLDRLIDKTLDPMAQGDHGATLTRPLTKADGWIDWNRSAVEIERQVRAMWDWPRGWTTFDGAQVQIHRASVDSTPAEAVPGTVLITQGKTTVTTGDGHLVLDVAQSAGSKPLSGDAWLQQSGALGRVLGRVGAPDTPSIPMIRTVQD